MTYKEMGIVAVIVIAVMIALRKVPTLGNIVASV